MARKKVNFNKFEVEFDDQDLEQDVDIKNKDTNQTKKGKKVRNPYIEVIPAPGQQIPPFVDGTAILTSSNPTCYWYYSGGWHVWCI